MLIISLPLIRVKADEENQSLVPLIKFSDGGWLEHNHFPLTLEGYNAALNLALNVMSGNFYPKRYWTSTNALPTDTDNGRIVCKNTLPELTQNKGE